MTLQQLEPTEADRLSELHEHQIGPGEVLEQLERIVQSPLFRNSKRYPAFLRYTVEHTLAGHTEMLKERTLGIEVFGRVHDYDTNADPVVRTTAGEIRKRLAQYYATAGHEHELRFILPVGSYVPHFEHLAYYAAGSAVPLEPSHTAHASDAAALETAPDEATILDRIGAGTPHGEPDTVQASARLIAEGVARPRPRLLWGILLPLLAAAAVLTLVMLSSAYSRERAMNFIWGPFMRSPAPTLIVIGVHSLGPDGKDLSPSNQDRSGLRETQSMLSAMISSDMVPVSDVVSYSDFVNLLARDTHAYRTQSAASTSFDQLQHGPILLIGGLDNLWTLRLTAGLRFHFVAEDGPVGQIVDRQQPQTRWSFDNAQRAVANAKDYALVASFQDPQTEQHVLIAAGLGKSGTAAAARFLTTDSYLHGWLAHANLHGKSNVELVLSTDIVEGQQGPPHVIADTSW